MSLEQLGDGNAYVKMLRLVVKTDGAIYDSIIGHVFIGDHAAQSGSQQA